MIFISNENKVSSEMIYLMGALRDATVDNRNKKNHEIKIYQKDERWLSEILKPIMEKELGICVNVKNHMLRLTRKKQVYYLQKISGIKTHGWKTPAIVKQLPTKRIKSYIIGFWDAEGGLPKNPKECKRAEQRYISFHQKQAEPLLFIKKHLEKMGFITTNITKCKGAFEFRITRREHMKRFIHKIGSKHPEKKERLKQLLNVL